MSELNLALQVIGLMRTIMSEVLEKTIKDCKSMKAICATAVAHPEVQEALKTVWSQ